MGPKDREKEQHLLISHYLKTCYCCWSSSCCYNITNQSGHGYRKSGNPSNKIGFIHRQTGPIWVTPLHPEDDQSDLDLRSFKTTPCFPHADPERFCLFFACLRVHYPSQEKGMWTGNFLVLLSTQSTLHHKPHSPICTHIHEGGNPGQQHC